MSVCDYVRRSPQTYLCIILLLLHCTHSGARSNGDVNMEGFAFAACGIKYLVNRFATNARSVDIPPSAFILLT